MGKGGHEFYKRLEALHKSVGSFDNGSCLSGHLSWFAERDSCSYRWQGLSKAKTEPGKSIYNSHSDKKAHLDGSGYGWVAVDRLAQGRGGKVVAAFQTKTFSKVTKKTGKVKKTKKQFVEVKNFTTGFAPYGNQVHHVLPVAVLRSSIEEVAKPAPSIEDMVGKGLLTEKYNINFKNNAIILPVEWREACKIGLPTHLGSHPDYSAEVESAATKAMLPYEKIAEQVAQGKAHDEPKPADLKDALMAISDKMYTALIGLRPAILGKCKAAEVSVNDVPKSVYACLGV